MAIQVFTPHPALRPLLEGLFDYAGLFPPASLDMDTAAREYLGHRNSPERSMVGPFVVPATRLSDMQRAFETLGAGTDFTLLPRPARHTEQHMEQHMVQHAVMAQEDFLAAKQLENHAHLPFRCAAVESRIPFPMVDTAEYASVVRIALEETGLAPDRVFLEIPRGDDFEKMLAPYFEALGNQQSPPLFAGKLRCGGAAPEDHPSSREVAHFILAGIRARCPFKFTAGLHHPFRWYSEDMDVTMHGFVNVLVATGAAVAMMEQGNGSNRDILAVMEDILDEHAPQAFRFIGDQIHWKQLTLHADALGRVRAGLALGIGSCSIKEPLDDLARYFPASH